MPDKSDKETDAQARTERTLHDHRQPGLARPRPVRLPWTLRPTSASAEDDLEDFWDNVPV